MKCLLKKGAAGLQSPVSREGSTLEFGRACPHSLFPPHIYSLSYTHTHTHTYTHTPLILTFCRPTQVKDEAAFPHFTLRPLCFVVVLIPRHSVTRLTTCDTHTHHTYTHTTHTHIHAHTIAYTCTRIHTHTQTHTTHTDTDTHTHAHAQYHSDVADDRVASVMSPEEWTLMQERAKKR